MRTGYVVSPGFSLVSQVVQSKPVSVQKSVKVNYLVVLDCSGSMWNELPKIREQLKRKLPKLLGLEDTLSIIWFSGRGQCGILLEAEAVSTLTDLTVVNQAIDRWLNPIGMTGFKEPLQEVSTLIKRIKGKQSDAKFSLFFMSDGCENQWPRNEVLAAVETAASGLSSATFVEYGYYADRPLLTAMAERSGGQLIFANGFDSYQPAFEAAMGKKVSGAAKVEVKVPGYAVGGFVFTVSNGELTTYAVEDFKAHLPEDILEFWYVEPSVHPYNDKVSNKSEEKVLAAAYAAISLYSVRMNSDLVFIFLKALGDVNFIERFSTCFGKQKYSEYMDSAKVAAFDPKLRFTKGWDPKKVPADDAYTVLDLLKLLASDDSNHVLFEHPDFKYSKIGRSRLDAAEVLTPEEQAQVTEITAKMAKEKKAGEIKKLQEALAAIMDSKQGGLKFVTNPAPEGYSISNLVYNADRPNVSIHVQKQGTVDLTGRIPDEFKGKIPEIFPTFVHKNYTVTKDGLNNIEVLPVRVTEATAKKLADLLPSEAKPTNISMANGLVTGVINLKALPIINRKMVTAVSAKALFELQYELLKTKAGQKVYKDYLEDRFPKKASATAEATYGADGAKWLLEQGFGPNGYAPLHTVSAESTDVYMGKELKVSVPGFSSLPKVADVKSRIASSKKQTTAGNLMAPYVAEVETYLKSDEYAKAVDKDVAFKAWVESRAKNATTQARKIMYDMACIKFSVIVGQVWPREFASLDENTLNVKLDGIDTECKVEMKEVAIKI